MGKQPIWYVEHPTNQFNEDVKKLAREAGLRIIDIRFKGKNKQCPKPPELTKKGVKNG